MPSEEKIPAIQLQRVKKYFPVTKGVIRDRIVGYVKALDGVDLELNANEVVGLVGESGSGKSTLAKIILLLEQPTEGQLIFEGKDVSAFSGNDIKRYRQKIQAVFQDPIQFTQPATQSQRNYRRAGIGNRKAPPQRS